MIIVIGLLTASATGCVSVSGRAVSFALIGVGVVLADDSGAVAVVTPKGVRQFSHADVVDSARDEKWIVLRSRTTTLQQVRKTDYDSTRQSAQITRTGYLAIDTATGEPTPIAPTFESADEKILGDYVLDGQLIVSTGARYAATESHAQRAWTLALPAGPWAESSWLSAAKNAPAASVRLTGFTWAREAIERSAPSAHATLANRGRVRIAKTPWGWRTWYAPPGGAELEVFAQNDLGALESSRRMNETARRLHLFR